jgi:hypothetical protein
MKQGSVVKVAFEQADRKIKYRPAALLKKTEPYGDWIVCAITSKTHPQIKEVDIFINDQHPDFTTWGLNYSGLIRVAFLTAIPESIIEGAIGNLKDYLKK